MQTAFVEGQGIDVLIVTAVLLEYQAVLAVDTGAAPGSSWRVEPGPAGLDVAFRTFLAADGGPLRIAATRALEMGGVATAASAAPLVTAYRPRCLAMCGVCAGRRGDVALGDVIIADRLWTYDTGALVVEKDDQGREVRRFKADPFIYNLDAVWRQKADTFSPEGAQVWRAARPRSYEDQIDWLLARLHAGDPDPAGHPERKQRCADYGKLVQALWKRGWLVDGRMELAPPGRDHIARKLIRFPDGLPEPEAHAVKAGPIGTGTQVVRDAGIFEKLSEHMRKVLGLEMEAAAIGAIAHLHDVPRMLVMKGVMDHADPDKSDNFKGFAARASAECLIAFVRAHLPAGDGEDEILVPGTSPLPAKHGPAALLNARHEVVGFVGRQKLIDDLRGWCEGEGRVGARLIHAAGGMGKTRLVIELCKRMRAVGWRAGFVPKELGVDRFAALVGSDQPVLAAIDYAESRGQLRGLMEAAAARRGEGGKKRLRLVLLARNADDWWTDLRRSDGPVKDLLSDTEPMGLQALADVGADRAEIFREAVTAFASLSPMVPREVVPSLEDRRYERALYVHMAALAVVEGREVKPHALMEDTLDHEERFWREQLRELGRAEGRVTLDKMRRAVSAFTLLGGAGDVAEAKHIVGDEALALLLRDLYPGTGAQYIGGLEPDLLGEGMVWRVLGKEGAGAEPYLDRVFDGAGERAVRTGFEVLGRLSEGNKEAEGWIARVLGRDVADSLGGMQSELGQPEAALTSTLEAVAIRRRLAEARPDAFLPDLAESLHNLSVHQNALGQLDPALTSAQHALDARWRFFLTHPAAFAPNTAETLDHLLTLHQTLGRPPSPELLQRKAALDAHLAP